MATWNVGPFDNDAAAEWCEQFEAAAPAERTEAVSGALRRATLDSAPPLSDMAAAQAVAAAAVVLQAHTGLPDLTTPHAPRFVAGADHVDVTPDLLRLTRVAVEVIMREDSSWRRGWADDVEGDLAVEALEHLYAALGGEQH
ncbi:DUF4259 domain-containing protein [Micromonospora sediminicola]|uniref:DUF4259 domain-containing protein n=1 Tax=Micromonospora sediminicola TaxID=946078 RepID=UPI00159EC2DC|nr:DUF4259 domain-containing protein [Micromonospora sediminicola]